MSKATPSEAYRIAINHLRCMSTRTFVATTDTFDDYFRGRRPCCDCKADWLEVFTEYLLDFPESWQITDVLGGLFRDKELALAPGETKEVSLDELGVPAQAEILGVSFVVVDAWTFKPAIVFGREVGHEVRLDPFPRTFQIHAVDTGLTNDHEQQHANLRIRYVAPGPDELPLRHLCEAGKHFVAGRYDSIILPANVAVESALGRALTTWADKFKLTKEAEKLLWRSASYERQLNALCPEAASDLGVPHMPARIRERLDELRRYRNDVVHRGSPEPPARPSLTKNTAAAFLTMALFGYQYARFLGDSASSKQSPPEIATSPS